VTSGVFLIPTTIPNNLLYKITGSTSETGTGEGRERKRERDGAMQRGIIRWRALPMW
jgi:hypothetical protein